MTAKLTTQCCRGLALGFCNFLGFCGRKLLLQELLLAGCLGRHLAQRTAGLVQLFFQHRHGLWVGTEAILLQRARVKHTALLVTGLANQLVRTHLRRLNQHALHGGALGLFLNAVNPLVQGVVHLRRGFDGLILGQCGFTLGTTMQGSFL